LELDETSQVESQDVFVVSEVLEVFSSTSFPTVLMACVGVLDIVCLRIDVELIG